MASSVPQPKGPATHGSGAIVRFANFELDTRSGELRDGAKRVRLQEQPFAILRLMLERPGQLVTREELRDLLWPGGTFVDFEHSLNAAVKRLRVALGDDADRPRFVETLPRRGYRFIASIVGDEAADTDKALDSSHRPRLAVLPFANLSRETEQEYFSDGLTEEMIVQLDQLYRGRVAVIARWSSMCFKGKVERVRAIGEALGADYLLEGSVRRDGNRARITARLVEARGETQLWSETYERHLADGLSVQVDVAARIARSLAMELAAPPQAGGRGPSTSSEAYDEYLRGRYYWNKLDDDRLVGAASAIEQALRCFATTLSIDPRFAPASAISAHVHIARAQQYLAPPRPELEHARTLALRALELDPRVAEAHLALADVRRMLEWDWAGAESSYRHAIALNPSLENVHRRYSLMLAVQSRDAEAVREADLACELDPFCLVVRLSAALVCYLLGRHTEAIKRCERILGLAPEYLAARRLMGAALLREGRTREALEALETVHAEGEHAPVATAWLAHASAIGGDASRAAQLVARLRGTGGDRYLSPYHLALAHVGGGALDEAWAALEQARTERDPALAYVAVEPRFEPLRGDSRYGRLLAAIGF